MITFIPDFVTPDELAQINAGLAAAAFADGSATAGWHARDVKKNLQLAVGAAGYEPLGKLIHAALDRNALFQMATRPRFIKPVLFNRYEVGMTYGVHIDDSIMSVPGIWPGRIRVDVAFTLFLADPGSYGGGELVVDHGGAEQSFKLPAGALIAYPATTLHRVAPVTQGARVAAVGWLQSELRDPTHRAIAFDLDMARRAEFGANGKSRNFDLLTKVHANLLHLWAEL